MDLYRGGLSGLVWVACRRGEQLRLRVPQYILPQCSHLVDRPQRRASRCRKLTGFASRPLRLPILMKILAIHGW